MIPILEIIFCFFLARYFALNCKMEHSKSSDGIFKVNFWLDVFSSFAFIGFLVLSLIGFFVLNLYLNDLIVISIK